MFAAWHAYAEHQDRDRLAVEMTPIQTELRTLLEHAANGSKRHRLYPPVREQPPEALARALDIHHDPRRHSHQQRRGSATRGRTLRVDSQKRRVD